MALALAVLLTTGAAPATAASKPYHLDVGRRSDFVAQTNLVQCVGASMQMMMNMIAYRTDRSAGSQLRYQRIARKLSGPRIPGRERRGASVLDGRPVLGGSARVHTESSVPKPSRARSCLRRERCGRPVDRRAS